MAEKITATRSRLQLAVLRVVAVFKAIGAWSEDRRKKAAADERGFITLEWVLLAGGIVLVAGIVVVIISAFLHTKATDITTGN